MKVKLNLANVSFGTASSLLQKLHRGFHCSLGGVTVSKSQHCKFNICALHRVRCGSKDGHELNAYASIKTNNVLNPRSSSFPAGRMSIYR